MKLKKIAILILGVIAVFLGSLWFLQGMGVLNVCPVLCFADCACVHGGSQFWEAAGAVVFIIGVVTSGISIKSKQTKVS